MAQQWDVKKPAGMCEKSGCEISEGEEFYSVLYEDGDTFRRADHSTAHWDGPPEGCFCYFKSRMPEAKKKQKLLVDDNMLRDFFLRLADETQTVRLQFRFVLALILMRKRILRYDGSATVDGMEFWDMTLTRGGGTHRVLNPNLTEDQIEEVSKQLNAILHTDVQQWIEEEDMEPASEPTSEEVDSSEVERRDAVS